MGEKRKSVFQDVVCARQMERRGIVGFRPWCVPDKGREEK